MPRIPAAMRYGGGQLPGDRGWVKVKNPAYWRLHEERVLAQRRRQRVTT